MPIAFPESRVVEIWRDCLSGRADLTTEGGESIKIVYPGRINHDRGADFLDAVIATGRGVVRGDIEIHVKSSGWRAHRHHRDPAYNRVMLHVVFWHDTETDITLQNGQKVPTLALHRFFESRAERCDGSRYPPLNSYLPCCNAINKRDAGVTVMILDAAGEERFFTRVADFETSLARTEANQTLYQGIMGALGYTKNKRPMIELARRMPLKRLKSAAFATTSDAEFLAQQQALLMGTAGLLPCQLSSQRCRDGMDEHRVEKLEAMWVSSREAAAMSEDDWRFFKVRPGNLPTRRIAAMSYLLHRYRDAGLFSGLIDCLDGAPADAGCNILEKSLVVAAGGMGVTALVGRGRAADIVVNVLLPFAAAWGRVNSRPKLAGKALEMYRHYPRLSVNTLEKHMIRQLGIGRYLIDSASRQQGLIHIYKTMCSQGECRNCPLCP